MTNLIPACTRTKYGYGVSLDQSCLMLRSQGVTGGCESSGKSGINIEITAAPAMCDKDTLLLSVIASKCQIISQCLGVLHVPSFLSERNLVK